MESQSSFKKKYQYYLRLLCSIAFLLFFINPINAFLNKVLVAPLLSDFGNTISNNLLLVVLCVAVTIWICQSASKSAIQRLAFFTVLVYLVMKSSGYWTFFIIPGTPFNTWDMIAAALMLPYPITLFRSKQKKQSEPTDEGFIEDLAIEHATGDSFKRIHLARELAKKISLTRNTRSFAIGILGEYGSGKTSFLNLIRMHLDKGNTEVIEFNPWSAENVTNIQKDFFDLLATRLHELNPKISSLLLDYSRKLSRSESSISTKIKQLGLATNLFTQSNYLEDHELINQLIADGSKKIVVLIDDVDRLYNTEVLEVLRLIRNTGNFNNVFYLIAYERSFVDEAIRSLNTSARSSFLDKIIQLEIPLPKRENEDLLTLLRSHLEKFVSPKQLEVYQEHIVHSGFRMKYDFAIDKVFRQSRDVIKFINNFKLTYGLIGSEVLFENLFVLELLKFRFPLIYDRLFEDRSEFIREHYLSNSKHRIYYELQTFKEDEKSIPLIYKKLKEENTYSLADIELICGLLTNLFYHFNSSINAKNSIIYPMFFERYFRFRLGSQEISEKQFMLAFSSGLPAMETYINDNDQKGLLEEVSTRILQQKPKNTNEYELQVESMFYLGPKITKGKTTGHFDVDAFTNLMYNYKHTLDKKYYGKDESAFTKFIESLFSKAPFPYVFHNEILYHIKNKNTPISVPKERLIQFQNQYLTQHITENGLSDQALWIFWWSRYKEFVPLPEDPTHGHEHFHFEPLLVKSILKILPDYDITQFLKYSIQYDIRSHEFHSIHKEVREMFSPPEELRKLVAQHTLLPPDIKQEYLKFYDTCSTNDFSQWPAFSFKTILKPDRNDPDYDD